MSKFAEMAVVQIGSFLLRHAGFGFKHSALCNGILTRNFSSRNKSDDEKQKMKKYMKRHPPSPEEKCTKCEEIDAIKPGDKYPDQVGQWVKPIQKRKAIQKVEFVCVDEPMPEKPRRPRKQGYIYDSACGGSRPNDCDKEPNIRYCGCTRKWPPRCIRSAPRPNCKRIEPPSPSYSQMLRMANLPAFRQPAYSECICLKTKYKCPED